ncbi:Ig-like domain-containing protein [Bacillus sp. NEB1478]|uniref:Ig-like domain-containing protein n=1 Tax=Bacillus sp. NEB1478 TaxID=3073816 RepID=UPI002873B48F|nr:Ig-like domain-containing protein [Bacillus sp. NEB1478]WNB92490.1 Ig-like domain-containing protein [Bacillus sp. NEB1478]
MKKLISFCIAAILIILQFSSLSVSASDLKSSYRKEVTRQRNIMDQKTHNLISNKSITANPFSDIKKNDINYFYEIEPNDTLETADSIPFETLALGQFLTYDDIDYYKVVVPSNGNLTVAGTTGQYSYIDLVFGLLNSDGDVLLPTDSYFGDSGYLYSYELTPGNYYILAFEYYGLTSDEDTYGLKATFTSNDTTPPAKPVINAVDNNDTMITGKAEAGSKVSVYRSSTYINAGTADSSGKFSIKIPIQKTGTTLSVYAKDEAGNKSATATTKVLDKTPPSAPTVNSVDDNDTTVKGKTEANATISVKKGTSVIGTAKANSKGEFSVTIKPVTAKTSLTITAKDTAGNTSKATTIKVQDKTAPKIISISPVDNNDQYVKGKTEANATVTVKTNSKVLGSATANSKGEFSVKIAAQKTNTVLSVTAKDAAGNTSKASTVTVKKAN